MENISIIQKSELYKNLDYPQYTVLSCMGNASPYNILPEYSAKYTPKMSAA